MTTTLADHLLSIVDRDAEPSAQRVEASSRSSRPSKKALWSGRVVSGLGVAFLAFDATGMRALLAPGSQG